MSLNLFWFLPTHGDGHYRGPITVPDRWIMPIYNKLPKRRIV